MKRKSLKINDLQFRTFKNWRFMQVMKIYASGDRDERTGSGELWSLKGQNRPPPPHWETRPHFSASKIPDKNLKKSYPQAKVNVSKMGYKNQRKWKKVSFAHGVDTKICLTAYENTKYLLESGLAKKICRIFLGRKSP